MTQPAASHRFDSPHHAAHPSDPANTTDNNFGGDMYTHMEIGHQRSRSVTCPSHVATTAHKITRYHRTRRGAPDECRSQSVDMCDSKAIGRTDRLVAEVVRLRCSSRHQSLTTSTTGQLTCAIHPTESSMTVTRTRSHRSTRNWERSLSSTLPNCSCRRHSHRDGCPPRRVDARTTGQRCGSRGCRDGY